MTVFVNGLKTAFLLGLLMGLCLAAGAILGGQRGLVIGFALGGIGVVISYFFSDKIALASVGATEIQREQSPELYAIVERLAQRANLPMPRVYYSPEPAPNAFATGRNPRHGVVCVTDGLLKLMDARELEGVLGHEMSHIKHRDILISSIAAVIAGAISWLAHIGGWRMMMGGGGGNREERENSPLTLILSLLMIILAPIAAMLIQMAISRSREYAADAAGARLAGGPEGLISALRKLEVGNQRVPMNISPAESHMFIIRPRLPDASSMTELFRTHPMTEKRIAKLLEQLNDPNPYAAAV